MRPARWFTWTQFNTLRTARLMCKNWTVISSFLQPINFSEHMRGSYTASALYWRNYLPTKSALPQIKFLANSKPAHKIMRALQACWERLNILNGLAKSLAAGMWRG